MTPKPDVITFYVIQPGSILGLFYSSRACMGPN